jgi:carbamoyltransferase
VTKPTDVLGISAFYHDRAAALFQDGAIVAAGQEERFTRIKADASVPSHAIDFCLKHEGISMDDVEYVGFYDKPCLKFERILETYVSIAPAGFRSFLKAGLLWVKEKLFQKDDILKELRAFMLVASADCHRLGERRRAARVCAGFGVGSIYLYDFLGARRINPWRS